MKKIILLTYLLLTLMIVDSFSQNATNPIINADVPDPDFIRVGSVYYMVSTTMYFNPGIPIMKSTDLVNWGLVNYCYSTLANTDALNLSNGAEAYSGGTWASSINYVNNTYYVSSFSYTTGKTYIYKTANIETGPWTVITLNKVYHDHSLFFDSDGRVYFAYGHDNIQLTEMKPDLTGELSGGINKIIIPKASSVAGSNFILTAEGTRLQKINNTYYVSNICWPSGKGRTQILHKSNSIGGTYTGRVVFQSSIGSAQGEYIETPAGKWYAMFFHDQGSVGRIPDLLPVTWGSDGWPVVGVNGQVPSGLDIPKGLGTLKGIIDCDEFSVAPSLKLQWQWNHNPQNSYWSLSQRSGFLRLTNERTDANVLRTTNTLTQRTFGPKCSGYIALDVSGMKDGDYAGLMALQNKYGFVGIKMNGTTKTIIYANGIGFSGAVSEAGNIPLNQNTVYLRVDFDFTNKTDKAYFYYSLNGISWTTIGSVLQMNYDLEHFTGYRFGLFSYATKSAGGYADFDFFRVGSTITEAQNCNSTPNTSPTVSLTSPSANASFTAPATISITANAADADGTVSSVAFYNGTTLLGTDATAPYTYSWTNVAAGTYSITARATDNAGATTTSSAVSVTVTGTTPNMPPTVSLTSPSANASFTAPATISITVNAADADGTLSSVAFYNGTTLLGTDATAPYSYSWTNVAAGTYSITARATDNAGATTTSAAVSVTVTGTTSTDPIVGPGCGSNNGTLSFSLNSANRANVTSYNWWYTGSAASTTIVSGAPYSVTIQTGANFSTGQVCVGTNLSVSPWYVQYCKTITKCAGAKIGAFDVEEKTEVSVAYPNPTHNEFEFVNNGDVVKIEIVNELGEIVYHRDNIQPLQIVTFGQHCAPGVYSMMITHTDGSVSMQKLVKVK